MDINEHEITLLIQQGESLTLEFKSDLKCLPDRDLIAAVVSLANTDGGNLLLGVEDDGTVTGLHANHINVTGIPSLIANKTNPAISVRVEWLAANNTQRLQDSCYWAQRSCFATICLHMKSLFRF